MTRRFRLGLSALTLLFVLVPTSAFGQQPAQQGTEDDTTAAPPSISLSAPADSALAARLRDVFSNVPAFSDVRVVASAGVVRLSGSVAGAEARENAVELARRFEGVVYVDDNLEAQANLDTRVTPAIQEVQSYINRTIAFLPVVAVAILVLLLFWWLAQLVGSWKAPFERLGVAPLLQNLIRRILRLVVFAFGLLFTFRILGITALVGAVVGTAGVVGIAIGFAFQDIVENYLAGVLMSLRQPFQVNDLVVVDDNEGKVMRMTSREVILMTLDGNHILIPNATVFKSVLYNYTRNPRRRFAFGAGVDVNENLVRVQKVGIDALRAMKGVLQDPRPFMRVEELGDSTVNVQFFGWVDQREADWFKVRSEAIRIVKTALDEAGVLLPEPIYNIRMQEVTPADEGPLVEEEQDTPPATEQPQYADVALDDDLDEQIREDLAQPGEENLLKDGRPSA
ncbi:MAG: mechanosensitive ion channel domain-containing protein [Rhodothermales bacterium]